MKTTKIPVALSLMLILVIAGSCRSSRSTTGKQYPRTYPAETPTKSSTVIVGSPDNLPPGQAKKIYGGQSAKAYAPGQRKKSVRYPLVIVHTPGIVISRHFDGRYYYRNSAGYTYWKGPDGRYFLDEKHLKDIQYDESEYEDWKVKGQKNDKANEAKGKEQEEKVKDAKEKDVATKGKDQNEKAKGNDQKAKGESAQKGKTKSKT